MSVSSFSQTSLPIKTKYQRQNAVIISEAQMDSISLTYMRYKLSLSKNTALKIQLELTASKLSKSQLETNFYKKDNQQLELLNSNLRNQIETKNELYDIEISKYKAKAKNKFNSFLLGISFGALISTLLITL